MADIVLADDANWSTCNGGSPPGATEGLSVPDRALLTRDGRTTLFVVADEGGQKTAKRLVVKTGAMSGGRTMITTGLRAGD